MLQKVVLKLEIHEDRIKQKAMKAVSGISGIELTPTKLFCFMKLNSIELNCFSDIHTEILFVLLLQGLNLLQWT